jgi:TANFOR domain-containing protein
MATKRLLVTALLLCFACFMLHSQNTVIVNTQVLPPYSPYLSAYVDNPNKLKVTLINTTNQPQRVKLWVQVQGDNGISATTSPGYTPPQPIELTANGMKTLDFNSEETRSYFDANHVDLVGITRAGLIQNQALPEGNYTICVRAFGFDQPYPPLSMEGTGCSAPFPVSYIDAPQPIQPACGNTVQQSPVQNVIFTWTPAATAPTTVQYQFTLKEVPASMPNPVDVIKNNVFPVLYSATVTAANVLVYTNALPQLEAGKKYVWRVQAIDPFNKVQFKNGGYSEPCSFTYQGLNIIPTSNTNVDINVTPPVNIPVNIGGSNAGNPFVFGSGGLNIGNLPVFSKTAVLNGRLVYKYPDPGETKEFSLKNANISLVVGYYEGVGDGTYKPIKPGKKGVNMISASAGGVEDIEGNLTFSTTVATTKTDGNGNFSFTFPNTYDFGSVGTVYTAEHWAKAYSGGQIIKGIDKKDYDGYVFASIVIENPHGHYYLQPVQLFDFSQENNLTNQKVVCLAHSQQFKAHLGPKVTPNSGTPTQVAAENMVGVKAYLLRKTLASTDVYPAEDALGMPEENNDGKAVQGMEVVASTVTDGQGWATFKRVVGYGANPYYIYFETNKDDKYYYEFTKPEYLFASGSAPSYTKQVVSSNAFQATNPQINISGDEDYEYKTEKRNWTIAAKMPRIFGRVVDGDNNNKPIQGAQAVLESRYVLNNNTRMYTGSYANAEELNIKNTLQAGGASGTNYVSRSLYTNLGGGFEFTELPILYDVNTKMPLGPPRGITISKKGYEPFVLKPTGSTKIKTLYYGEQYPLGEIILKRQSEIVGRVVDEVSGQPLKAYIHMNDDEVSEKTSNSGYFDGVYATKIPGLNQKVIIESDGYINDTIELEVKNAKHDLGEISMAKRKRKLVVWVKDAETDAYMPNAKVEVLNVVTSCTSTEIINTGGGNSPLSGNALIQSENDCPLQGTTGSGGAVVLNFENGGYDNNITYQVRVTATGIKDYEPFYISTKIPYSADWGTWVVAKLKPGTCVSGVVKNDKGEPVAGAKVKMDLTVPFFWSTIAIGEIEAETNSKGEYKLRNVPVRDFPQKFICTKPSSNYAGDSWEAITKVSNSFYLGNNQPYLANGGNYNWSSGGSNFLFGLGGGGSGSSSTSQSANNQPKCLYHDFKLKEVPGMDVSKMLGFPIEVTEFKQSGAGIYLSGNFVNINGNEQFKPGEKAKLPFSNLLVKAGSVNGPTGKPYPVPVSSSFKTDGFELPVKVFYYNARLSDDDYIKVQNENGYGTISGNIKLQSTSFNNNDLSFDEDIYVGDPYKTFDATGTTYVGQNSAYATNYNVKDIVTNPNLNIVTGASGGSSSSSAAKKPVLKLFYGNTTAKPYTAADGFVLCDKEQKEINFSLVAFPKMCTASPKASRINGDIIYLNTTLHTKIDGLTPSDMKIFVGDVKLVAGKSTSETQMYTSPLNGNMGNNWAIKSSSWNVGQFGLRMKTGTLLTGIEVPFEDVYITSTAVKTDKAKFKFDKLTLANGKIPLSVVAENKALGYFYMEDGYTRAWQFSAFNSDANPVAEIKGLDGIKAGQSIKLKNIFLYSNSAPSINILPSSFNVHEIIAFSPSPKLVVNKNSIKLNGTFATDIPGTGDITSSLFYDESMKVAVDVSPFQFKTGNIYYVIEKAKVANRSMQGEGYVYEDKVLPKLKIDLIHTGLQSTEVKLKNLPENKIQSGGSGGLKNLLGGNTVLKTDYTWGTLSFEGITFGTAGMEGRKMKFDVTGGVVANDAEIGVDNIPTPFGGMKWVYLMNEGALNGSVGIDNMDIGGMVLNGSLNARIGNKGWYFKANGNMQIPSVGGGGMYMLIGMYSGKGSELISGIGNFGCLPSEFQSQIKGFLFQASITRNIADISGDILLVKGGVKVDATLNARVFGTFGGTSTYGLGLLAKLTATAYLESPATCTSINATALAEAMVEGKYVVPAKTLTLNGCISLQVLGKLYQCVPVSYVCPPVCVGDAVDKAVGINATVDSNKNFDIKMFWGTCTGNACKVK